MYKCHVLIKCSCIDMFMKNAITKNMNFHEGVIASTKCIVWLSLFFKIVFSTKAIKYEGVFVISNYC